MPSHDQESNHFDCVIIGGGPAGLSCALLLARHRRKVVVIQGGPARNFAAQRVNGLIGRHGVSPAELLRDAREEAVNAGAHFSDAPATALSHKEDEFVVVSGKKSFRAARVVLAYGLKDILPAIDGAERLYGRSIYHCPTCDGFEVNGKEVFALGTERKVASLALELLQWAKRVTILTNGKPPSIDSNTAAKLTENEIDIITDRILHLTSRDERFAGVELAGGRTLDAEGLFFALGTERCAMFAEELGCKIDPETDAIEVNDERETNVPGVYAVGDLIAGPQLVAKAAADGAAAAVAIHKSLLSESRVLD